MSAQFDSEKKPPHWFIKCNSPRGVKRLSCAGVKALPQPLKSIQAEEIPTWGGEFHLEQPLELGGSLCCLAQVWGAAGGVNLHPLGERV